MSYSSFLLAIDMGIIGTITALIVTVAVLLARREDQRAESSAAVSSLQHARSSSLS